MAGSRTRCSLCRNFLPGKKDELIGGPPGAPTKNNNTSTFSLPIFQVQIPASTPAPAPALLSNEELFQQFMKAYLEIQNPNQASLLALI